VDVEPAEVIVILQEKWVGYRSVVADRDWWALLGED